MAGKVVLAVALLAMVAMSAGAPPMDAKDKQAKDKVKDENRAKWQERAKEMKGNNAGKGKPWGKGWGKGKEGMQSKERFSPEMMEDRRKASALFAAIVLPKAPKSVTFPLSEEDTLKFHAAREGLMEWVHTESKQYDLSNKDTKQSLRDKTTGNQEQTRKLLVDAVVKSGMTLQQARVGLIVAQFEALDANTQKEALAKGKERMDKMPAGARDKAANRQLTKHNEELDQLKALKTDTEKEEWVNKRYKPSVRKLPKLLE